MNHFVTRIDNPLITNFKKRLILLAYEKATKEELNSIMREEADKLRKVLEEESKSKEENL
jgi:hypothetical protein